MGFAVLRQNHTPRTRSGKQNLPFLARRNRKTRFPHKTVIRDACAGYDVRPANTTPMKTTNTQRRTAIEPLDQRVLLAAANATIDFGISHQTMEGNGAALISWLGHNQLPEYAQASFYDQLVNDLGTSAVRGPIWQNFEQANDNADPNVFDWTKFDKRQLENVMTFFQRLQERGVKTFLLSVWSPPYWQKTNLSTSGGGQLRNDMRAEFAEFLAAAVISAKRDFGIDISAVSVQNEQFFNEYYESALMDNLTLRETTLAVQKKFQFEGLTTKVLANEDLGLNDAHRWKWFNDPLLADPEIDRSKLIIGSHYTASGAMPLQAEQLDGSGIPLWYTEVSGKPPTWESAIYTAVEVSDAYTKANASAYFYWQFSNTSADQTSALMQNGVPNPKYHAVKHLYKYIRPGMERVETQVDNALTNVGAYRDPKTGASTITLINVALSATDFTLNMSNFAPGTVFKAYQSTQSAQWVALPDVTAGATVNLTLPARSMLTLYSGDEPALQTGNGTPVEPPIISVKDAVQQNPLRLAAMDANLSRVQQLIAQGVDVNAADPVTGWTALHAASASVFHDSVAVMNALLAAGANPLAVDYYGSSTLHAVTMNLWQRWEGDFNALMQRNIDKINLLLNAGVNVNALDNQGRTPLHWVAMLPHMYSEYTYNTQPLTHLLNNGADRSILDVHGRSAYDYATNEFRSAYADQLRWPTPFYDTAAPLTRFAKYDLNKNQIDLTFTENVTASLSAGDITILNLATNQPVSGWSLSTVFQHGISVAKVTFTARLAEGRYRLTLPAGAIADQNGLASTTATTVDFTSKRGDTTGDGIVDFSDLLVLAQNYGKSNRTWSQGDLNGDAVVNFDDLLILAQHYGTSLLALPAERSVATGRRKVAGPGI